MSNVDVYKQFLAAKGISLEPLGLREVALNRGDALSAIRILRDVPAPILGGDVYFRRNGSMAIAYANWHVDRETGEQLDDFVERSCRQAEKYIDAFPHRTEEDPLFVLVVLSQ